MHTLSSYGFDEAIVKKALPILDPLPMCTYWKDINLKYVLINDYAAKMAGYTSSEVSFRGVTDPEIPCKTAELADVVARDDRTVLRTARSIKSINFSCYANNEWRLLLTQKSPFKNCHGQIIGICGQSIDITGCGFIRTAYMIFEKDKKLFGNHQTPNQSYYTLKETIEDYRLSVRESECLFYLIRGKTSKEIASILNISFRTVEKHFERLKYKMNCFNRSEIIEKAICEGLGNIMPKSALFSDQLPLHHNPF